MLLLAVDTSGKHGSIALAQCGPKSCDVLEVVPLEGGTFSAQLVPQIAALLGEHGFGKQDLDAFAVASGPGSFTGLRVGLAAVKALAEVTQKPIVAVSLLEVLVEEALHSKQETMWSQASDPAAEEKLRQHPKRNSPKAPILPALDAGRGEIYVAEYDEYPGNPVEKLIRRDELASCAGGRLVITPDEPVAEAARAFGLPVVEVERPRSNAVARLGWRKLSASEVVSPQDLEANYIRRSDAEIFSKP